MDYTVTLELPECEGESPIEAVRDFQAQADQINLFVYRVQEDHGARRTFLVDMATEAVTPAPVEPTDRSAR